MRRVLIIYKSGAQIEVECEECVVRKRDGVLMSITLQGAKPGLLLAGIHDIAAVWDLSEDAEDKGTLR